MPAQLLLSVKDVTVRYGLKTVFEGLSFNIHEGVRIALVGKNGAGKSTLMNIVTGKQDLHDGERIEEPGVSIGYLLQDIIAQDNQTVFDYIVEQLKPEERELSSYKVDIIAEAMHLDIRAQMTKLSGGQLRRAGLARVLVEEPDILLLDEPTNHLDLEAIEWLETYLKGYRGTLICVSHDRTFLANITNRVLWLDRGQLKISPRGFKHFEEWSSLILEQEERELHNRKQAVALEVAWASKGVKARRKRNQRRLAQVYEARAKLKSDAAAYRKATSKITFKGQSTDEMGAKVIAEFYNVSKSFIEGERRLPILDKFSLKIMRGDRIGILGKNGSGKTSFLKLLVNELEPDQGRVKRKKELEFSYFDQKRSDLKPMDSLKTVLSPAGGDYIDVMGKQRHICGYLRDFMFDPSRVEDYVTTLSGGQKNRLMLAKVLANPKSCLILDEPTNDLDVDTLDMLMDILANYKGTLIIVSHDRDFLDQTVTKILAFEGDSKVEECIGGYTDYVEWKQKRAGKKKAAKPVESVKSEAKPAVEDIPQDKPKSKQKLTYKLRFELEQLPTKIEALQKDIATFTAQLTDSTFYQRDAEAFHKVSKALGAAQAKLDRYETRWLELEEMQNK